MKIQHAKTMVLLWACLCMNVAACEKRTDEAPVPVPEQTAGPALPGPGKSQGRLKSAAGELRVAVAPVISPEESLIQYQALVDYLAGKVSLKGVMLQRSSYSETNTLIRQRQCDVAFVCTYAYVQGNQDFGLQLLVVPSMRGKSEYRSLFIVPSGSTAASLLDLKGKRFASADPLSNTGWLYPSFVLRSKELEVDGFFGEVLYTGGHDRTIMAVARGLADGAAVDSLVWDQLVDSQPDLKESVKVIHTSVAFGMPPVVVHPQIDPDLRDQLRQDLLTMHEYPAGAAALATLHIDRFLEPDPSKYALVKEMMLVVERRP